MAHEEQAYDGGVLTVSCHVERPLDDRVWEAFSAFLGDRPGGAVVAALLRPPEEREGERWEPWLERARTAAASGPLGVHTHWTGIAHARPSGGDPAALVREQGRRLAAEGLAPTLFCGGGWYWDEGVGEAVAELGWADCTATAFRPSYLPPGAPRLELAEPAGLVLRSGARLLVLPSTHSIGMAARAVIRPLPRWLHVYFHDTDLVDPRRRAALAWALRILGARRRPSGLDELRERPAEALRDVGLSAVAR